MISSPDARADAEPGLAIEARGLTKRYGAFLAVDQLDLSVPYGSIFGFLGPNGAGKTSTLRMLAGLSWPTAGSAIVDRVPVTRGETAVAARIGYLEQNPRFYGWMSGRELLQLAGRTFGLEGEALRARVDETLETVGLAEAGDRRVGGYSGGMLQRLGVGQAILTRPRVVFLDEPVSALDPAGRRDILELIGSLRGETTVFMSTHILNDVERVCDRIAILDRGRLVTEAAIGELLARHAKPVLELDPEPGQTEAVARLIDALAGATWARDVREQHGMVRVNVTDADAAGAEILSLVAGSGVRLARYERVRPDLEDVFLQLVGTNGAERAAATMAADAALAGTSDGAPAAPPQER
jgi:ABC-2 type transport system ATP-binding protein